MNARPRNTEGLNHLLDEIRRLPPLTRTEEHALAVRARNGDPEARQELVRHHLVLAVSIARRQRRGAVPLEDVIQEGSLGLLRAVESFDPDAGTRFSTYAVWWIRAYVGKYLQQVRSSVRPRRGTIAQYDVSLDAPIAGSDGPSHLDQVGDEGPSPDELYERAERDHAVRVALNGARGRVSDLGWDIVRTRLSQDSPETLEQIARRWQFSREWVRQVEHTTRKVLRTTLEAVHEREAA